MVQPWSQMGLGHKHCWPQEDGKRDTKKEHQHRIWNKTNPSAAQLSNWKKKPNPGGKKWGENQGRYEGGGIEKIGSFQSKRRGRKQVACRPLQAGCCPERRGPHGLTAIFFVSWGTALLLHAATKTRSGSDASLIKDTTSCLTMENRPAWYIVPRWWGKNNWRCTPGPGGGGRGEAIWSSCWMWSGSYFACYEEKAAVILLIFFLIQMVFLY